MARYLVISSQVAHGHVGLSAIVPALQMLGHEVIALPTILLSNHPGHRRVVGTSIDPQILGGMLDAIVANGRLDGIDGVLTGYLPSVAHVEFARLAVVRAHERMANVDGSYLCDPVLGDDPKGLYVPADVAAAIRDLLVPMAHTLTPNRFELSWLSGSTVADIADAAVAAAKFGSGKHVCATSIPASPGRLATVEIDTSAVGTTVGRYCAVDRRASVPHGTGDLLSALLLTSMPLGQAVACVDAAIAASSGMEELNFTGAGQWLRAVAISEHQIGRAR